MAIVTGMAVATGIATTTIAITITVMTTITVTDMTTAITTAGIERRALPLWGTESHPFAAGGFFVAALSAEDGFAAKTTLAGISDLSPM
jgi:hypothetical protein